MWGHYNYTSKHENNNKVFISHLKKMNLQMPSIWYNLYGLQCDGNCGNFSYNTAFFNPDSD